MVVRLRFDPVGYLVDCRFPGIRQQLWDSDSESIPPKTIKAMREYQEELEQLPEEELAARVEQENPKEEVRRREKAEREEQMRFFNRPNAKAGFAYWSRAAYWTTDEAVALTLGKEPEVVTWKRIESLRRESPFAAEFSRRKRLIERAVGAKQLTPLHVPAFLISWLQQIGISCPAELETEVASSGHKMLEWLNAFAEFRKARGEIRGEPGQESVLESMERARASLDWEQGTAEPGGRDEVGRTQARGEPKGLRTKERDTVLKLIIGMAMKGYAYDPAARRSPTAAEIAGDLAEYGLSLDPDTIRKWLKEAADILPRESE